WAVCGWRSGRRRPRQRVHDGNGAWEGLHIRALRSEGGHGALRSVLVEGIPSEEGVAMKIAKQLKRAAIAMLLGVAVSAGGSSVASAAYPEREITLIVPFPAGGAVDQL